MRFFSLVLTSIMLIFCSSLQATEFLLSNNFLEDITIRLRTGEGNATGFLMPAHIPLQEIYGADGNIKKDSFVFPKESKFFLLHKNMPLRIRTWSKGYVPSIDVNNKGISIEKIAKENRKHSHGGQQGYLLTRDQAIKFKHQAGYNTSVESKRFRGLKTIPELAELQDIYRSRIPNYKDLGTLKWYPYAPQAQAHAA